MVLFYDIISSLVYLHCPTLQLIERTYATEPYHCTNRGSVRSKVNTYWQSPAILWEVTSYFLISDVPMTAK